MARFSFRAAVLAVMLVSWTYHPAHGQVRNARRAPRHDQFRPVQYTAPQYGAPQYAAPQSGRPRTLIIDGTPTGPQSMQPGLQTMQPLPSGAAAQMPAPASLVPVAQRGTGLSAAAPGYPYLNAPLYTSPQQYIPYQTGTTIITNQALAPHEMLHPHEYEAMYPPFYYKVRGSWFVWPWGVSSYDRWELQGTEVEVEYKSHISPFAGFVPPVLR